MGGGTGGGSATPAADPGEQSDAARAPPHELARASRAGARAGRGNVPTEQRSDGHSRSGAAHDGATSTVRDTVAVTPAESTTLNWTV